jgi:hypothetical protein
LALVVGFVYPTAYSAPTTRAIVETVMTLFGLATVALLCQQFLRMRRLRTLLLLGGLATFALTEFVASALPQLRWRSWLSPHFCLWPLGPPRTLSL